MLRLARWGEIRIPICGRRDDTFKMSVKGEQVADIRDWLNRDLWSERDFSLLCCGRDPRMNTWHDIQTKKNEADEAIRLAVLAEVLPAKCPVDATPGDRLYQHARFFKLSDAIRWASARFEDFPFSKEDILSTPAPSLVANREVSESERSKMLAILLGMAMDAYSYKLDSCRNDATGENKNSIHAALERHGLKADPDTIRKYLTEAASLHKR